MKAMIAASGLLFMQPCERPPVAFQADPPPAVVIFAHPDVVDTICREASGPIDPTRQILACTNVGDRVILMPNPCLYQDGYAQLMCHEASHLNGWRHGA